jgi:16S rRNA (cytidine1402-2'-O)-methyltransferase
VTFGTPHRLGEALSDIEEVLGNRRLSICCELTKVHDEIFRGRVSQAREHFVEPRGEFSLVIEGKTRAWLKFQERS